MEIAGERMFAQLRICGVTACTEGAPPAAGLCLRGAAEDSGRGASSGRGRRSADLLQSTAYLKLTLLTPAIIDTAPAQQFLSTLHVPHPVAGTLSTITALDINTECDPLWLGSRDCRCLPGYQWSDSLCNELQACGGLFQAMVSLIIKPSCQCLRWNRPRIDYCVPLLQASPVSETSTLAPQVTSVGEGAELMVSFNLKEGATDVKWFLLSPEQRVAKEIRNGTQVTLLQNGSQALLRVFPVSPDWAGEYICHYWHESSLKEVRQVVNVPLVSADIVQTLSQISMNCSSPETLTLQCCIRNRGRGLRASWNPGLPNPGTEDPLCHFLTLRSCPNDDTMYLCTFQSDALGSVQTTVTVSVLQAGDIFCPSENSEDGWNATKAGRMAERLCPEGTVGKMLRSCFATGTWGDAQSNCTSQELLSGLHRAQLLQAGLGNPQSEISWMMDWLPMVSKPSEIQEGNPWELLAVINAMDVISQVALNAAMRLDGDAVANFLIAASWMLTLNQETEWTEVQALQPQAGSRFLQAIEDLTSLLLPSTSAFNLTLPNIELHSNRFDGVLEADYSKTFSTEPPLCTHITKEELDDLILQGQNITITSLVLKLSGILPANNNIEASRDLGSLVMTNSIMSPNGSIRHIDIDMTFGHWNMTPKMEKEELVANCVFWNHSLFEGMGGWSTQGCKSTGDTTTNTNCTCSHLTSFSILMSAKSVPVSFALTFLSKFGVWASVLALVTSLIIYYLVWTSVVKNKLAYFRYTTLVNAAFSLLMGNFWFLGASQLTANHENKLCVAAAFFTHFCYLAMFCWMLVQALLLFHQLIFVFHQLTISSVTPAMVAVGYILPLVIAVATVVAFFPKQGYVQEAFCWLSSRSKAIYTFSVPVLLVVTINLLILFVVLLKLMRPSVSEGPQGEDRKALLSIFKALLILTPVFGLTWGLGVITMTTDTSQVTHYAFTILNSFQGVFILLFGCLMDKKGKSLTLDSKLNS
ncbi:adhesion G-protein coupled receptor F3 [Tiliqua scincoides]|uniref:adhesion G-protein coupled receptor F3 n=1 Tax=Tiliqua scincoides TaxID=71010 RepID=UPI00346374C5